MGGLIKYTTKLWNEKITINILDMLLKDRIYAEIDELLCLRHLKCVKI